MQHFVSVIFEKQLNENKRDIVLDTMINTARVGLVESDIEYELFESENSATVLRLPLSKPISLKNQQKFVEALANKLFDKGHNNFEIELTEATLRRGSRGPEVQALQQQLGVTADGIFGPATEQALRAFQQRAGIQVDGIAGGQTQAALAAGGAPRNAGAARPSTAPFRPGQGSATRAQDPQPARSADAGSPQAPAPGTGSPDAAQAAGQQTAQQRRNAQAAANTFAGGNLGGEFAGVQQAQQRRNAQAAANTYAGGNLAGEFDTTATGALRARQAGQPAPTASNRPDPNDPRGNQIAPRVAGRPDVPTGQLPRGAAAAAPAAAPATRQRAAQTTTGSARPAGQPGRAGMAGDETNALDAIAADRASGALPTPRPAAAPAAAQPAAPAAAQPAAAGQTARDVFNQIRDMRNAEEQGSAERTRLSNLMNQINVSSTSPEDAAQILAQATSAPAAAQPAAPAAASSQEPAGAGQNIAGLQQQWQQLQSGGNADAITTFVGGLNATQKRALGIDPLASTAGDLGLGTADTQATRGAAVAATNPDATDPRGDQTNPPAAAPAAAPAAPTVDAPSAAQSLSAAMRGFGTDEDGISSALQNVRSQADWEAVKQAYDGDLLADLRSELNRRDYQRYVTSVLQAAGIQESVPPRPKGAFQFRERAEWDELFATRYNKDGSPKNRLPILESKSIDEETYHGDEFFENYGVMWFNEDEELDEAEYQGRKVKLGKPMRGDVKKFKVYVKNPKGNVVKVNFGDPDMKIKKSNPERRRSFRARHNCDNPGPRHKARYWSCRKW